MPATTLTELHTGLGRKWQGNDTLWRFSPPEGKLIGANTSHDPHLHAWRQKRNSWWLYIHNFGRFNLPILVALDSLNPDFATRWSIFSNQIHICNCLYTFVYCFFSRIECRTILQEGNKQVVNLFAHFPLNQVNHFLRPIFTLPMRQSIICWPFKSIFMGLSS